MAAAKNRRYDLGIIAGVNPPDPAASNGAPSYASLEPTRWAMGDTLHYAQRMTLIEMEPRGDLSSTGYALANPGQEYLVLQPSEADSFTVTLEAGTYAVEWISVNNREVVAADDVKVDSTLAIRMIAPFETASPAVLYLRKNRYPETQSDV